MTQLRDCGIYRLPDGYLYVAVQGGSGAFYLFDCATGTRARPIFEVTPEGRVARWFNTGPEWWVEDVSDTGETFDGSRQLKCS